MSSTARTSAEFEAYRSILEDLYWNQNKSLKKVKKIMKDKYNFEASTKTYKYYLKEKWGKKKYASQDESFAMLEIRLRRRIEENKETEFIRLDRKVDNKNLDRFAKRHEWNKDSSSSLPEIRVATPPNIRYRTPDPDTPNNSPSPTNPSYLDSTASEEERASIEEPHRSYRAHSAQNVDMLSTCQYAETRVGPQPSNHTSMPIQFSTSSFPGHLISHSSQGFPQANTEPNFPRSPYQHHTELSPHTSPILVGGVSSWGYNPQPSQHTSQPAFGMDTGMPAFGSNYTPHVDQGTVAAAPFYDATQNPEAVHAGNLASGVTGNVLLHDTVVSNNVPFVGAMAHSGVDLSSTMVFSHADGDTLGAADDVDDNFGAFVWPEGDTRPM